MDIDKGKPYRRLSVVDNSSPSSISYRTLVTICVSFIVGVIATLVASTIVSGPPVSFSVEELISFVFGIALSAASTILAIEAISLGKLSEQAIVERSDESIRLQNDIL